MIVAVSIVGAATCRVMVRLVRDGAPGLLHGLMHAVGGIGDVGADIVLHDDHFLVDFDGGFDVAFELLVQAVRALVVEFFVGVFGLEGAVVPDRVAEAELLVFGEAELVEAVGVGALGDEFKVGHFAVWVVFVGGEVAAEVGEALFISEVAKGEYGIVFDETFPWGIVARKFHVVG